MSDDIRRVPYSFSGDEELFEQARDELSDDVSIDSEIGKSAEVESVEESDPDNALTDRFVENPPEKEHTDRGADEIRKTGFRKDGVSLDDNEGLDRMESATNVQKKQSQMLKVNDRFRNENISRRYVVSKADVPESAFEFEDSLGHYYYDIDKAFSPQECVEKVDMVDSWFELNDNERAHAAVLGLSKAYPWALEDIMTSEKSIREFVQDVFKIEGDVVEERDIHEEFTVKQIERICEILKNR